MDTNNISATTRIAGYAAIIGALTMLAGAAVWGSSGADLDMALSAGGDMAGYLNRVGEVRSILILNLSLWIVGVFILAIAGTSMANLCVKRQPLAQIAKLGYLTAVALGIASFFAWFAVILKVAPGTSDAHVLLAEALGWFASRTDWIATVMILSLGPVILSIAGRGDWVPKWLSIWSIAAAIAGLLSILAMYADGLTTYGFMILPVGLGWTLAAGIVLLRSEKRARDEE